MKFDYLINKLKERIFPFTHVNAVLTDDENKNLKDVLTDIDLRFDQIQQSSQSDWDESNEESASYIKNKPSALPASGGNADTVDNKHASDFANATDLETHITSDASHETLFAKKLDMTAGERMFNDVTFNIESGIIEFKRLDNSKVSVNIPVGLLIKSGYFDNDTNEIVLVLKNKEEIRIPAISLVDVYTGSENEVVQLVVGNNNVISAIVKQGSITKELFSTEVQTALTSLENMKHEHTNKAILDVYDQTNEDIKATISKSHSHLNSEALDSITSDIISKIQSSNLHSSNTTMHVPDGGTSGQILSAGSSGVRQWINLPDAPTNTFSGSYNDLTDKPILGTASAKNIAASGNASASQVVMGNDTRLTDSRKASDVSAWAKASTKPEYTKAEVGLGNVDNTSDANKNVLSAAKLTTPRTINGVNFDGTANITISSTPPSGYKTIIYSLTEPINVGVDEIVFVYE